MPCPCTGNAICQCGPQCRCDAKKGKCPCTGEPTCSCGPNCTCGAPKTETETMKMEKSKTESASPYCADKKKSCM
ncbi:hypothetical protein CYMTET_14516 [Cymbomonas tetramitiformis]|uniref:Uncharacterized protein n=1 Tax=Cymbomonas tetramitiformis TaxID=36881 RepID=A0AAE0GGE7_9CHLO|nr:hypothetical protein CYMTET_14516 [Cymbomonas tetramitiformis]